MPLLPQEPHHSLFFTNAPCCQPDWPLCAGFANKFRLRFSSDTRRILTQRIVATLINDVKINRVPALSENALFQLARSLVVVSNGTWSEENDRGYGKEKGKKGKGRKIPAAANERGNDRFAPKFERSESYRSVDRTRQAFGILAAIMHFKRKRNILICRNSCTRPIFNISEPFVRKATARFPRNGKHRKAR